MNKYQNRGTGECLCVCVWNTLNQPQKMHAGTLNPVCRIAKVKCDK